MSPAVRPTRRAARSSTSTCWPSRSTAAGCARRSGSACDLAGHAALSRDPRRAARARRRGACASTTALDAWMLREVTHTNHISRHLQDGPGLRPDGGRRPERPRPRPRGAARGGRSIMPDCVRANTNATAMMIGERVAEHDRRRVGQPARSRLVEEHRLAGDVAHAGPVLRRRRRARPRPRACTPWVQVSTGTVV